jgi:hypothetical protein
MNIETFKKVLYTHNKLMAKEILNKGGVYRLGKQLGNIFIKSIRRNHKNPKINFGETNKRKRDLLEQGYKLEELYNSKTNPKGIKYVVYHDSPTYCKLHWDRDNMELRNLDFYNMKMTGNTHNKSTFKYKFINAIKSDPFLEDLYIKDY